VDIEWNWSRQSILQISIQVVNTEVPSLDEVRIVFFRKPVKQSVAYRLPISKQAEPKSQVEGQMSVHAPIVLHIRLHHPVADLISCLSTVLLVILDVSNLLVCRLAAI